MDGRIDETVKEAVALPIDPDSIPEVVLDDNIYCFLGDPPEVDGRITASDRWEDTIPTYHPSSRGDIRIRAKHDGERLYLLIENKGDYSIHDDVGHIEDIFFEDDGLAPERELDGMNEDCKYVGSGTDAFCDAHWSEGWSVGGEFGSEKNGGCLRGVDGEWKIAEWWTDLNSGSDHDISVSSNETLGFSAGWGGGWPNGTANQYDASSWGSLHVIFDPPPTRIFLVEPEEGEVIVPGDEVIVNILGEASDIGFQWDPGDWTPMEEGDPIPTDGMSDGTHLLRVRCTVAAGRPYEKEFHIDIDAQRPEFGGITSCVDTGIGIELGWEEGTDEHPPISYNIYVHREGMPPDEFVLCQDTRTLSYTFTDLKKGEELTFKVRAVDSAGWEDLNDDTMSVTPGYSLPIIKDMDLDQLPANITSDEVFCFQGTEPLMDGRWSPSDGWEEVPVTILEKDGGHMHIRSKHDTENIYFLFECSGDHLPSELVFEDDGLFPQRMLDPLNEDRKYIGVSDYPDGYRDARYDTESGWPLDNRSSITDGEAYAYHQDGLHTAEFGIPLSTGEQDDINVSSNETLGFAVSAGICFPGATTGVNIYNCTNWGSLHVIYEEYAGDVAFFGPPDGSGVDPGTTFGLHVSMKDVTVHVSLNNGNETELEIPYVLDGKYLMEGENVIVLTYSRNGVELGRYTVNYILGLSAPYVEIVDPANGSSYAVPVSIDITAVADPDTERVAFYYLDEYDREYYLGDGEYSSISDTWSCRYNSTPHGSHSRMFYVRAWDEQQRASTSDMVYIEFYTSYADDDLIDDDVYPPDDDAYPPDDDDVHPPDGDQHLLYLVFLMVGIVIVIAALILALFVGIRGSRDERTENERSGPGMIADKAGAMSQEYQGIQRPNVTRPVPEEQISPPEAQQEVPLTEEPLMEQEPVREEEPAMKEDGAEGPAGIEEVDIGEEQPDEEVIHAEGEQREKELHGRAKYLKDDGVVGGQLGPDEK